MKFSLSVLYSGDKRKFFQKGISEYFNWHVLFPVWIRFSGSGTPTFKFVFSVYQECFPKGHQKVRDLHFSYWNWNLKVVCNLQGKLNGSLPSKYISLLDEVCYWVLECCVTFTRQKWPPHNQYISIQFVVFLHVYSDLINLQLDSSCHCIATK